MPKRPAPIESLNLEPDELTGVKELYDRLLAVLRDERRRFGARRFGEIDQKLGRRPGYTSRFLAGEESITVDRLLAFLSILDRSLTDLTAALALEGPIPTTPEPQAFYPPGHRGRSDQFRQLSDLVESIEVNANGSSLTVDTELLLDIARRDHHLASSVARRHIETFTQLGPESTSLDTADNLCWVLGIYSSLQRTSGGDLTEVAQILEIAFTLEAKAPSFGTRSFLFRESAYLMIHLGRLREADQLARDAVELAILVHRQRGLGESLYARATIVRLQGAFDQAFHLLTAAVPLLDTFEFRQSAELEASLLLVELGKLDAAETKLQAVWSSTDDLPQIFAGRVHLLQAIIDSEKLEYQSADEHFNQAEEVFDSLGSAFDKALFLLYRCMHQLRAGQPTAELARKVPALASEMEAGSSAEAALLAVSRYALSGEISQEIARRTIRILDMPWSRRARTSQNRQATSR